MTGEKGKYYHANRLTCLAGTFAFRTKHGGRSMGAITATATSAATNASCS